METTPALLQIAPRFCIPPTAGAEFRSLHLARRLARHMAVTHVGFRPSRGPVAAIPDDPRHRFVAVPRRSSYRLSDLLRGALGSTPFSVRNYTRARMKHTLDGLLREQSFDIALLEGVHLGGYLPLLKSAACRPAVVCDWHNVESEILQRYAGIASGAVKKRYARLAAARLERYERWFVDQCDLHVVVSERDRQTLAERYGSKAQVVVIENGIPLDEFPVTGVLPWPARFRVLFVGAMDYHANIEAVTWFASEVWPAIRAALPHAVFTVVGRNPAPSVRDLGLIPGVEVTGTVAEVRPFYEAACAVVVPLRVGGGTRIKILEAMAAGVPVVSTRLGAEGLSAVPGQHYRLADSSDEMRAAVTDLVRHPEMAGAMAAAAREFIARNHDWATLGDRLAGHLLALAAARGPRPKGACASLV